MERDLAARVRAPAAGGWPTSTAAASR